MCKDIEFTFQDAEYCCIKGSKVIQCVTNCFNSVRKYELHVSRAIKDEVDLKISVYRHVANNIITTKVKEDLLKHNLTYTTIEEILSKLNNDITIREDILFSNYERLEIDNNVITFYSTKDAKYKLNYIS